MAAGILRIHSYAARRSAPMAGVSVTVTGKALLPAASPGRTAWPPTSRSRPRRAASRWTRTTPPNSPTRSATWWPKSPATVPSALRACRSFRPGHPGPPGNDPPPTPASWRRTRRWSSRPTSSFSGSGGSGSAPDTPGRQRPRPVVGRHPHPHHRPPGRPNESARNVTSPSATTSPTSPPARCIPPG